VARAKTAFEADVASNDQDPARNQDVALESLSARKVQGQHVAAGVQAHDPENHVPGPNQHIQHILPPTASVGRLLHSAKPIELEPNGRNLLGGICEAFHRLKLREDALVVRVPTCAGQLAGAVQQPRTLLLVPVERPHHVPLWIKLGKSDPLPL